VGAYSSPIENVKSVEPVRSDRGISCPQLNARIEIGFERRHGDGSSVPGGIDSQIVNIDDVALVKAI
jgi:hypothetical protein